MKSASAFPFDTKDLFKIIFAFLAFGVGWFADNQATVIAFSAMVLVWLISTLAERGEKWQWINTRAAKTILVFVVSFGLSLLFQPIVLPSFPGWTGDAGTWIPLFSAWIAALFGVVNEAVLFAMTIYNVLLAQVLEKLPAAFRLLLHRG